RRAGPVLPVHRVSRLAGVLRYSRGGTVRNMRHLGSLLAGILIAPVAWLLIALGQQKSTRTVSSWLDGGVYDTVDLIVPAAYLVAAGVLIGLVATLRISPVGAVIAGAAYVAIYVAVFISPLSTLDAIPDKLTGLGLTIDLRVPVVNGTLAVVGAL